MNDFARYHRQILLPGIGEEGQAALASGTVLVAGCGALGTVAADLLARAGVGTIVVVDRDVVEATNLQRQTLFTERDAERGMPKAEAAKLRLAQVNSTIRVRGFVEDLDSDTIGELAMGCDVLLDGLDNFQTRYLLNDYAVAEGVPYLYGAGVKTGGMSMPVLPPGGGRRRVRWSESDVTPCLRCLFPDPPPPGAAETCDTAGVLGSVTMTVAAHLATQAIKLLVGRVDAIDRTLRSFELWENEQRGMTVDSARNPDCPCCVGNRFDFLDAEPETARMLCGRNAVQIRTSADEAIDLHQLAERLANSGSFEIREGAVRGTLEHERSPSGNQVEMTVFADGRAIIGGDVDVSWAKGIRERFIGR